MIEDTSLQVKQIADTYIKDPVVRSQYLEDMKYNMRADTGIPEYLSDESLSEEMNLQYDEDVLAGTEKALTKVPVTEETVKNMMSNMYTYTLLEKSYPSTAVVQSWTDKDLAQKMLSDDVFLINATNTEQDYPIYMTRSNIFNSHLLDAMDRDSPSIVSYIRRIGTPIGLAAGFSLMKSALGTFLAHGVSAAYDTVMIGDTIYNTQKKYNDRMYQLIADRTMTLEEYQKACEELFNDINANVPEEYRYEIYKGLYEGPDPFADMGLSFSGAALEANFNAIKTAIRGTLGASRKALKAVKPITNKEAVTHTEYNEELVQHINDWLTNKVNEDAVDEIVESKNVATKPADVTPETEDVAKGLMKNKEIDDNLLQNSNNDKVLPALSSFGIRGSVPDAPDTIKSITNNERDITNLSSVKSSMDNEQVVPDTFWQQKRLALSDIGQRLGIRAPLGEIKTSENRYSYFIDHGKGVDNLPVTYKEALKLQKQLQSNAVVNVDRKNIPVYLNTFTGKNPIKYPYKYIFDDENSEPYVLKTKPEDFKEIPVENQNKYKEADEKFNKWKQNIKDAVYEKYPEKFEIVGPTGKIDRNSWNDILETYVKDILNVKEDTESWLRSELNKMGFSAWLHMHHDNAMNVVTINDKDFSAITRMDIFKNNFTDLEQQLWDNGFGIVEAGDGVGYRVRELHGVKDAKPMIIKNEKVVDFGDYKPYNGEK